jgi:hypothetical protein
MVTRAIVAGVKDPQEKENPKMHKETEQTPQDAIKEALNQRETGKPLREKILMALSAEGVDTIPELIDRLLAFQNSMPRKPHDGALPAGHALTRMDRLQPGRTEIVHRPPLVPLYVDGLAVEPADIVQFNGEALHFLVSKLPQEGEVVLNAFTGPDYLNYLKGAHAASFGVPEPTFPLPIGGACGWMGTQPCVTHPSPSMPPFTLGQIQMFSDIEFKGDWFWLSAGYAYPDLRKVKRACTLWFCGDWNDVISSMAGTNTRVTYFTDINYGGSSYTIPPNTPFHDLRTLGLNDTISSIINWG